MHLNFRSRADQRGRTPEAPSYFLKPPTSISGHDDDVVKPQGTELLVFEGEIAIVIGSTARRVTPDEGASHIGWITAVDDFGVYDLRWADRGSNLLAKGHDTFTPIGPALVPASELDLTDLTLQTRVDGAVVQDDHSQNMIFSFGYLIADLSRFMTLVPGDIILSGTPAGSAPAEPGQTVEVEVSGVGTLRNKIVQDDHEPAPWGAQPRVDDDLRAAAYGT
ncbi:MAG TPA: fumarylacetoacetate hydrolase family protein [Baekduia sp.]|nr:fumarylacetoacetate hydrolase family protein [Baekduia sp.]